jgi:hypothetical protein
MRIMFSSRDKCLKKSQFKLTKQEYSTAKYVLTVTGSFSYLATRLQNSYLPETNKTPLDNRPSHQTTEHYLNVSLWPS